MPAAWPRHARVIPAAVPARDLVALGLPSWRARGYYGAMDSGLFTKVLTSPEVIVTSLALILLLPLVFFIASTRSRRRLVRVSPRSSAGRVRSGTSASAVRRAERAAAADDEAGGRSGGGRSDPNDGAEDDERPGPRRSGRGAARDEEEEPEDRA